MSLTLRGFALRVCYFLGYYEERIRKLEDQIAILKQQNERLCATDNLYITYCFYPGCSNWCVSGTHAGNDAFPYCDICYTNEMCPDHRVNWKINADGDNICSECRNI